MLRLLRSIADMELLLRDSKKWDLFCFLLHHVITRILRRPHFVSIGPQKHTHKVHFNSVLLE